MKITILGAGAFGVALGGALERCGHTVFYYDPKLEGADLGRALEVAEVLFMTAPSTVVGELVIKLPKHLPLVVATKGLLSGTIFDKFTNWAVLSGATYAKDVAEGHPVEVTVTDEWVAKLFDGGQMRFDYTDDKDGVLMCGALKNVYAIEAGRRGLDRGSAKWLDYIRMAAAEMEVLLQANGARAETVHKACGVADLELTCGPESRNYQYGRSLVDGGEFQAGQTVEGLATLERIHQGELVVPERGTEILRGLLTEVVPE